MTGFGPSPERDARFRVAKLWRDCENLPEGHPQKTLEFLHRQMNEEVDAVECSARSICDFPDADWETRMFLARQCSDEARHALMYRRLFLERGGAIGAFPVLNFQYEIICGLESLAARLAVQNRTFEAEGIDAIDYGIGEAERLGDEELVELLDAQFADEIQHVRRANEILRAMIARQPRVALEIARALHRAKETFSAIFGSDGAKVVKYTLSADGRREAGFEPREIEVGQRLAIERQRA